MNEHKTVKVVETPDWERETGFCKHQQRWLFPSKCEKKGHVREGRLCPTAFFECQELCRDYKKGESIPVDTAGF